MKIKAVAHICLLAKELEPLLRFYRDMLGLELQFNFIGKDGKVIGFYLKIAEGMYLEAFEAPDASGEHDRAAPLTHFCLETDDIRALRQKLADNGYEPTEVLQGADHSWQFWVRDPAGIFVEFHEYTPESAQLTGLDVTVPW